jgi:hypothetical protein
VIMESKVQRRKSFQVKAKEYKKLAKEEKDPDKKKEYENLAAKFNGFQSQERFS